MWQNIISYTIGTLVALFPIANPVSAVPIFHGLTADDSPNYRLRQAQKIALNLLK
jgi:multiple antibiotic resistance protein